MAAAGKLAGEVAIVTAAGQGLGEEISKRFAGEGAKVAVVDLNEAEAQRVAGEITAAGGSALALKCDATKRAEVKATVDAVLGHWGTVDILVNAAGGFHQIAPITAITEEEWDRVVNANLKSAFLCAQAVAQTMIDRRKGRIISISSGAGVAPNPYAPTYLPYAAGKAGLIGFSKILARDLGQFGITVNTVAPGTTLTPRVKKVRDAASIERLVAQNPMRTLVEPEDCSAAVLFLASRDARYITGVNLNVNAGNIIV